MVVEDFWFILLYNFGLLHVGFMSFVLSTTLSKYDSITVGLRAGLGLGLYKTLIIYFDF